MAKAPRSTRRSRIGVVDIGSNSIRLVVFDGITRAPQVVFNEKVLCGLGRGLDQSGVLNPEGVEQALGNLNRFVRIGRAMGAKKIHLLATAAVRDAGNGGEFCRIVENQNGMKVRILSGEEEAQLSALGVIAGTPGADGMMGDLGGGSLELVRLNEGALGAHGTLPLGPVRLLDSALGEMDQAKKIIDRQLATLPWLGEISGRCFYAVGGAWRNLARIHRDCGDRAGAFPMLRESAAIIAPLGDVRCAYTALEDFASLLCEHSEAASVAQLYGAAEAQRELIGHPLTGSILAAHDHGVAAIRQQIDAASFAAAWAAGRSMHLDDAMAFALSLPVPAW